MKVYKVKCNKTGLFWKGGGLNKNGIYLPNFKKESEESQIKSILENCFSPKGKTWNQINFVRSAYTSTDKKLQDYLLENCTIIEYLITENQTLNFVK